MPTLITDPYLGLYIDRHTRNFIRGQRHNPQLDEATRGFLAYYCDYDVNQLSKEALKHVNKLQVHAGIRHIWTAYAAAAAAVPGETNEHIWDLVKVKKETMLLKLAEWKGRTFEDDVAKINNFVETVNLSVVELALFAREYSRRFLIDQLP